MSSVPRMIFLTGVSPLSGAQESAVHPLLSVPLRAPARPPNYPFTIPAYSFPRPPGGVFVGSIYGVRVDVNAPLYRLHVGILK